MPLVPDFGLSGADPERRRAPEAPLKLRWSCGCFVFSGNHSGSTQNCKVLSSNSSLQRGLNQPMVQDHSARSCRQQSSPRAPRCPGGARPPTTLPSQSKPRTAGMSRVNRVTTATSALGRNRGRAVPGAPHLTQLATGGCSGTGPGGG